MSCFRFFSRNRAKEDARNKEQEQASRQCSKTSNNSKHSIESKTSATSKSPLLPVQNKGKEIDSEDSDKPKDKYQFSMERKPFPLEENLPPKAEKIFLVENEVLFHDYIK